MNTDEYLKQGRVMNRGRKIVMPIYEGVTHLDFTGPHQFLSRMAGAEVIVGSLDGAPVIAEGLQFCGLEKLETIEACDVLCVPGGTGCVAAMENNNYLNQVRRLGQMAKYVTSVCTGSLILGAAGFLAGKQAACHWAWRDMLALFGAIPNDARVVRDGNILTGGGVTAGIDLVLTLIAELAGKHVAESIQLSLEYAPAPPFEAGSPETAPEDVLKAVSARLNSGSTSRRERVANVARNRQNNIRL